MAISSTLPFEVNGPKSDYPIVLVPDGISGWGSWKPHAEVLSRNHQVIRMQLLNVAASENNQSLSKKYSLRSESHALRKTLDKLGVQKVHLAGWSEGGVVSLDFALNFPGRVRTLSLIEPAAHWIARAYHLFEKDSEALLQFLKELHNPPTEDELIQFLTMGGLVSPDTDPRHQSQWIVWNSHKAALSSIHTVVEHTDDVRRLKLLRNTPVLLVKGKDSIGINAGIVSILLNALGPWTEVLILPDAHACHLVAKDQYLLIFRKFLSNAKR